jgi:hypothetical protein
LKKYVPAGKTVPPGISTGSLKVTTVLRSPFCAFAGGGASDAMNIKQNAAAIAMNRFIIHLL